MPLITVIQAFSYWHKGHERRDYEPGAQPVEVDDECAAVAVAEGWASDGAKAMPGAPENKDAAPKRRVKGA
jgi:hypothetical protein